MKDNDKSKSDENNWSEIWITGITGLTNTILVSTAPSHTSITLVICLSLTAITYLICRTSFKIAKIKYAPHSAIEFSAQKKNRRSVIQE